MSSLDVPTIGRCIGCDQSARLDNGVCQACINCHGRPWAAATDSFRRNPKLALVIYARLKTNSGQQKFLREYAEAVFQGLIGHLGLLGVWKPGKTILPPAILPTRQRTP